LRTCSIANLDRSCISRYLALYQLFIFFINMLSMITPTQSYRAQTQYGGARARVTRGYRDDHADHVFCIRISMRFSHLLRLHDQPFETGDHAEHACHEKESINAPVPLIGASVPFRPHGRHITKIYGTLTPCETLFRARTRIYSRRTTCGCALPPRKICPTPRRILWHFPNSAPVHQKMDRGRPPGRRSAAFR
jgi:hypothetical protein